MGYGNHCKSSPRYCFPTQDYNEWMNIQYHNTGDDENIIPNWFYLNLLYCDECENYIEFVNDVCSNHHSYRLLVTCKYCQKDVKTFNNRDVRCSSCCRLIRTYIKNIHL